jgi:hypothetical protein
MEQFNHIQLILSLDSWWLKVVIRYSLYMFFNRSGSGGVAVSAGLDDLLLEGPLQQF